MGTIFLPCEMLCSFCIKGWRFSRGGRDGGTDKDALFVFLEYCRVGDVVNGPVNVGKAFRRFEAEIDMGGSISSGNSIGCRMLPGVDAPPNDFESVACPFLFEFSLLSHDKVRRRGMLYSPPDTSVSNDKNE